MSEYMEEHSVARLIGAPPGYVGHDEGGQLTEAVRRRPYNVVLFDEIEKAHRNVLNILLQLLDDGRLTDSTGKTVDFTNTIVILTSNIGAEYLLQSAVAQANSATAGKLTPSAAISEATRAQVMAMVQRHFRPEFLNRLDDIVIFQPLGLNQLRKIVEMNVQLIEKRLQERDISLELDHSAVDFVLQQAYDPIYGARPLRRFLEKNLVTLFSRRIFEGQIPNHCVVRVSADEEFNTLRLTVVRRTEAAPESSSGSNAPNKRMKQQQETMNFARQRSRMDVDDDDDEV